MQTIWLLMSSPVAVPKTEHDFEKNLKKKYVSCKPVATLGGLFPHYNKCISGQNLYSYSFISWCPGAGLCLWIKETVQIYVHHVSTYVLRSKHCISSL